jgi:hypothetical protein
VPVPVVVSVPVVPVPPVVLGDVLVPVPVVLGDALVPVPVVLGDVLVPVVEPPVEVPVWAEAGTVKGKVAALRAKALAKTTFEKSEGFIVFVSLLDPCGLLIFKKSLTTTYLLN